MSSFCLLSHSVPPLLLKFCTSAQMFKPHPCGAFEVQPVGVHLQVEVIIKLKLKRKLGVWGALLMDHQLLWLHLYVLFFIFLIFCLLSSTAGCSALIHFCNDECCFPLPPLRIAYPREATHGLNSTDP